MGHPSHVPDHHLNRSNGLSQLFSVYVRDGLSLSSAEWSGTRPFRWWPTTSPRTGTVYFPKLQTLKCSGKETRNITHQVIKKVAKFLISGKIQTKYNCGHTHRAAASTKLVVHSKWVWTGQAVVTNPVQVVEDVRRRSLPSIYRLNDVCVCVFVLNLESAQIGVDSFESEEPPLWPHSLSHLMSETSSISQYLNPKKAHIFLLR